MTQNDSEFVKDDDELEGAEDRPPLLRPEFEAPSKLQLMLLACKYAWAKKRQLKRHARFSEVLTIEVTRSMGSFSYRQVLGTRVTEADIKQIRAVIDPPFRALGITLSHPCVVEHTLHGGLEDDDHEILQLQFTLS